MRHGGAPGVQHRREADLYTETLRVGRDRQQRLGARLEQQVVDHGLVLERDGADPRRQREHDVEVGHLQQLGLARLQPLAGLAALALRAVPIAAAVVGDGRVAARVVLATRNMAAEGRRAAALDRAHHLELGVRKVALRWHDAKQGRGRGRYPRPPALDGTLLPPATSACPSWERAASVDRAGLSHRAAPCSRHAHSAPSCRAWNGPEPPGSREYRHPAPEDASRTSA